MIILGIETSCDETALALLETRIRDGVFECKVIASEIHSQADLHSPYGGVFPTLAKREHEKKLVPMLKELLENQGDTDNIAQSETFSLLVEEFRVEFRDQNTDLFDSFEQSPFLSHKPQIDAIAVTEGPGLEPALWTGITFAKMLSRLWEVPLVPVNHMEGHVVGSLLNSDIPEGEWQALKPLPTPALALLISGGHTELVSITHSNLSNFKYSIIGQTKDDAVGEAFDKAARLIGLPYPGGPHISKLAAQAREQNISSEIKLPRPMIASKDLDFSFSGLKTAVLYAVREVEKSGPITEEFKMALAREFEDAVTETLSTKLKKATEQTGAQSVIIGGGVSANTMLRESFQRIANEYGISLHLPSPHISGDNALMIALAGALDTSSTTREIRAQGTKKLGV
ncbi:MAG: tRNA (adenosine(37)-N6)-threonylcarbamoyltransferase complex transferase subunit TsaD [bacterium]|nr:tRNA (adenosine(37)-N6)-threonylcarbamoyltransferase complex transferase subunit TsaD [bacterium]